MSSASKKASISWDSTSAATTTSYSSNQASGYETNPGTATRRDVGRARGQRRGGAAQDQPDRAWLVGLLPNGGVQHGVQRIGRLRLEAHIQVGQVPPPEQVAALDC